LSTTCALTCLGGGAFQVWCTTWGGGRGRVSCRVSGLGCRTAGYPVRVRFGLGFEARSGLGCSCDGALGYRQVPESPSRTSLLRRRGTIVRRRETFIQPRDTFLRGRDTARRPRATIRRGRGTWIRGRDPLI
jgi:hypothetical protein